MLTKELNLDLLHQLRNLIQETVYSSVDHVTPSYFDKDIINITENLHRYLYLHEQVPCKVEIHCSKATVQVYIPGYTSKVIEPFWSYTFELQEDEYRPNGAKYKKYFMTSYNR